MFRLASRAAVAPDYEEREIETRAHFPRAATRNITGRRPRGVISREAIGMNPAVSEQAAAASAHIYARYEGLINAVREDRSLSPEQRAGIIASLRARAKADAAAVSQRIMEEAKGAAKQKRQEQKPRR